MISNGSVPVFASWCGTPPATCWTAPTSRYVVLCPSTTQVTAPARIGTIRIGYGWVCTGSAAPGAKWTRVTVACASSRRVVRVIPSTAGRFARSSPGTAPTGAVRVAHAAVAATISARRNGSFVGRMRKSNKEDVGAATERHVLRERSELPCHRTPMRRPSSGRRIGPPRALSVGPDRHGGDPDRDSAGHAAVVVLRAQALRQLHRRREGRHPLVRTVGHVGHRLPAPA